MRFHAESRRDAYDAIVVGAGLGGLTAAALLARAGRSVLVVERHDRVGGYAHAFRRGRYLFDSAVHMVGGCEPVAFPGGGLVHRVLTALGVRDRLEFTRVDPLYEAHYPGTVLRVPADLDEFTAVHTDAFPSEKKGLRQVLGEFLAVREETRRAGELGSFAEVMRRPGYFPTLLRYRRATLERFLAAHVESPELAAALGTLWPYVGLPPSRVSFLYFATMLTSYLADGAFYCLGSFQRLADALAAAVTESGGEVLLRSAVRRIRVEDGRTRGIVLENGQRIDAPLVVSNADAGQTFTELVGSEACPASVASLKRLRPSLSAFVVYAAAELDVGDAAHETFVYPGWDHDAAYAGAYAGAPDWLSITLPTRADPSLAPPGEQLLVLTTLVDPQSCARWRDRKQALAERLLARAGAVLPGLASGLRFCESATPRTLERYTRNAGGAAYGWELSPAQVGPGRPGIATEIPGLLLAGHWTQPGGGVYGVVTSGLTAARVALGLGSEPQLWAALSRGEGPSVG